MSEQGESASRDVHLTYRTKIVMKKKPKTLQQHENA